MLRQAAQAVQSLPATNKLHSLRLKQKHAHLYMMPQFRYITAPNQRHNEMSVHCMKFSDIIRQTKGINLTQEHYSETPNTCSDLITARGLILSKITKHHELTKIGVSGIMVCSFEQVIAHFTIKNPIDIRLPILENWTQTLFYTGS